MPYNFTYMWNLRNKTNEQKQRLINTENRLTVAMRREMGEIGEGKEVRMFGILIG